MSGDVMLLKLICSKGKIYLQNPVTLQEPYYEAIEKEYEQIDYKVIVKSRNRAYRDSGWSEYFIGYMAFSQNNMVLFIPADHFSITSNVMQWQNTRGYAAYMEKSDIVFWFDQESSQDNSTLKLSKHHALVWDFPLLKSKYAQMDIHWESESARNYAMSFFKKISSASAEEVSWRLYSIFDETQRKE